MDWCLNLLQSLKYWNARQRHVARSLLAFFSLPCRVFLPPKPDHGVIAVHPNATGIPGQFFPDVAVDHHVVVGGAFFPASDGGVCIGAVALPVGNFKPVAGVFAQFFGFVPHAFGVGVVVGVAASRPASLI